jgi:hypothetical protein
MKYKNEAYRQRQKRTIFAKYVQNFNEIHVVYELRRTMRLYCPNKMILKHLILWPAYKSNWKIIRSNVVRKLFIISQVSSFLKFTLLGCEIAELLFFGSFSTDTKFKYQFDYFTEFVNTLWHTTNAICCFSAKKLMTRARLFKKWIFCCFMKCDSLKSARCHHL